MSLKTFFCILSMSALTSYSTFIIFFLPLNNIIFHIILKIFIPTWMHNYGYYTLKVHITHKLHLQNLCQRHQPSIYIVVKTILCKIIKICGESNIFLERKRIWKVLLTLIFMIIIIFFFSLFFSSFIVDKTCISFYIHLTMYVHNLCILVLYT